MKPVTMFRAEDGTLFATAESAALHDESTGQRELNAFVRNCMFKAFNVAFDSEKTATFLSELTRRYDVILNTEEIFNDSSSCSPTPIPTPPPTPRSSAGSPPPTTSISVSSSPSVAPSTEP